MFWKKISLRNTNKKIDKLQKQMSDMRKKQDALFEFLENIKNEDIRQHTFLQKMICLLFEHEEQWEEIERLSKKIDS